MENEKEIGNIQEEERKPETDTQQDKDGNAVKQFLSREFIFNQLPFMFFLAFLGMIYIGNRYHAEKIFMETNQMEKDLKELHSEYVSTSSDLMYISKQSEVVKLAQEHELGLQVCTEPPKKITVKKKAE